MLLVKGLFLSFVPSLNGWYRNDQIRLCCEVGALCWGTRWPNGSIMTIELASGHPPPFGLRSRLAIFHQKLAITQGDLVRSSDLPGNRHPPPSKPSPPSRCKARGVFDLSAGKSVPGTDSTTVRRSAQQDFLGAVARKPPNERTGYAFHNRWCSSSSVRRALSAARQFSLVFDPSYIPPQEESFDG